MKCILHKITNNPILTCSGIDRLPGLHRIQCGVGGSYGTTWNKGIFFPYSEHYQNNWSSWCRSEHTSVRPGCLIGGLQSDLWWVMEIVLTPLQGPAWLPMAPSLQSCAGSPNHWKLTFAMACSSAGRLRRRPHSGDNCHCDVNVLYGSFVTPESFSGLHCKQFFIFGMNVLGWICMQFDWHVLPFQNMKSWKTECI